MVGAKASISHIVSKSPINAQLSSYLGPALNAQTEVETNGFPGCPNSTPETDWPPQINTIAM